MRRERNGMIPKTRLAVQAFVQEEIAVQRLFVLSMIAYTVVSSV